MKEQKRKLRKNHTVEPLKNMSDIDKMNSYFLNRNLRDYALWKLGINTGRRVSDYVKMNVRDIAEINKRGRLVIRYEFKIYEQKTGKYIEVTINSSARKALQKYFLRRKRKAESLGAFLNEPLFTSQKPRKNGEKRLTAYSVYRILNEAGRACGLSEKIGTHTMRKTFGYFFYFMNDGKNIEWLQKIFNHSNSTTTLRYIGIEQDNINDVIEKLVL